MIALQILSWIQRSMRGFLFNKWDVSRSNSQKSGEGNFHWSFSSTILCTYTPHLLWRVGEPLEQCKKQQQRAVGGTDLKKCVPLSIQGNLGLTAAPSVQRKNLSICRQVLLDPTLYVYFNKNCLLTQEVTKSLLTNEKCGQWRILKQ